VRTLALLFIVGCGRIGFDAPMDGRIDRDGHLTDTPEETACGAFGPWTTPQHLDAVATTTDDWEPALSPDGENLVFSRADGTIQIAPRTGTTFGPAIRGDVFLPDTIGPAWSPSGDALYVARDPGGGTDSRLYRSQRLDGAFPAPVLVPELAGEQIKAPAFSADGLELYFSTGGELGRATRGSTTDPWQPQGIENQLDVTGTYGWPTLSADGLTLMFEVVQANRARMYISTRPTTSQRFGTASLFDQFGSDTVQAGDPELSRDGRILLFAQRDDAAPGANFDLYMSTRSCL
jgi:Tol biopolymer transport system component